MYLKNMQIMLIISLNMQDTKATLSSLDSTGKLHRKQPRDLWHPPSLNTCPLDCILSFATTETCSEAYKNITMLVYHPASAHEHWHSNSITISSLMITKALSYNFVRSILTLWSYISQIVPYYLVRLWHLFSKMLKTVSKLTHKRLQYTIYKRILDAPSWIHC